MPKLNEFYLHLSSFFSSNDSDLLLQETQMCGNHGNNNKTDTELKPYTIGYI